MFLVVRESGRAVARLNMSASLTSKIAADNWLENHPRFQALISEGVDKDELRTAMLTYMDLANDKCWWSVSVHPQTNKVTVSGRSSKTGDHQVALPVSIDDPISAERLHSVLKSSKSETGLVLPLVDSDSTMAYYKVTEGLRPPDTQAEVDEKKRKKEKKFQRKRHLREQLKDRIFRRKQQTDIT